MKAILWLGLWTALTLTGLAAEAPRESDSDGAAYRAEIESWRVERVAQLTRADSWLAYLGTHGLSPGANTVGHAPGRNVLLDAGPPQIGVVSVEPSGRVMFAFAQGVAGEIDGHAGLRRVQLTPGQERGGGTVVSAGSVSFFVLDQGGRKALRAYDSEAPRRKAFAGLDYFPIDPAWRIEARWEPFETARFMPIPNIAGQTVRVIVPGRAVFERDGQKYELLAIDEGGGGPLMFIIADATSGKETYGACRFIYAERPQNGKVSIDFNRAENPPCAFTPLAVCPLPPPGNKLALAVMAGEKMYQGPH